MLMQSDGGHDCNPETPRNIATNIMASIELQLEHAVSMKNSGSCSAFNPLERPSGKTNFYLQGVVCERGEHSIEVEEI